MSSVPSRGSYPSLPKHLTFVDANHTSQFRRGEQLSGGSLGQPYSSEELPRPMHHPPRWKPRVRASNEGLTHPQAERHKHQCRPGYECSAIAGSTAACCIAPRSFTHRSNNVVPRKLKYISIMWAPPSEQLVDDYMQAKKGVPEVSSAVSNAERLLRAKRGRYYRSTA